jgi:hypothetical protein
MLAAGRRPLYYAIWRGELFGRSYADQLASHLPFHLRYPLPVPHSPEREAGPSASGLCSDCMHSRVVESARGSAFILCNLSQTDPRFPKYPRLPVLSCDGYKKKP